MMPDRGTTKILVVDDASFMRAVLKDILHANGFTNIYEASDGTLAVDGFRKYKPDIVTMDVNMPNMDGVQALRSILQIDPRAKVIMVTSVEQRHVVQEAMKLGAKDYVVKPFERNMVSTVVNRVLRSR
jgi:two-component system chemotaxis response regulator CheY